MLQESRIAPAEPGRRTIPAAVVDGTGPPPRLSQLLKTDPNKRLLELEFENKILLNKLDKYHRVFARGVDFVTRDLPSNLQDVPLNYNNKTNYVNILQDRLAAVTREAESQGKQELMEQVRLLEVQRGDQRDTLDLVSLKYIKLKQKYLRLQRDRQQVRNIIETSKAIRSAINEFERFATISQKTLRQIDFQTFDLQMSAYEEQLKEETSRAANKLKKGNDAAKAEEVFESKKKEKLISSLQDRVKELAQQLDEAQTQSVKKEEQLAQDFAAKLEAEKKRAQSLIDEAVYKQTQRARQMEEEAEGVRERFKGELASLTEKFKLEAEEKARFREALNGKEVELDSVNKKYNEAKLRIMKEQERFKKIMADQKISMSKIMGSAIKMSAVSKSVLEQIEGFERKKSADGRDVVELDADQMAKVKADLQNMEELSSKVDQLTEMKDHLEKENEELEQTVNGLQAKLDAALNAEEALRVEVSLKTTEAKSLESKLAVATAEAKSLESQLQQKSDKLDALEREVAGERKSNVELKDSLQARNKRVAELEAEERKLSEERAQLEADVARARREIGKLEEAVKAKSKELESAIDQNGDLNERFRMLRNVNDENKELRRQIDQWKAAFDSEKRRNRTEEKNYIELIKETLSLKEQCAKLEGSVGTLKAKYKSKIAELKKAQKPEEMVFLEQLVTEKEGNLELLREEKRQKTDELMAARDKITASNDKINELSSQNLKLGREVAQLANYKGIFEQMKSGLGDYLTLKEQTETLNKANAALKAEIDDLNMQLLEARKVAERLKIQLSKTDQQVEITTLKKMVEEANKRANAAQERSAEVEKEKLQIESALKEASQDLLNRTKQNERFEARLKEVEAMFLGGTGKKSIQSFELQAANAEIQRGVEERSQLHFKLSTLELLNAEQKNTIARLEDKLQELKARTSMNVSLNAALEARDQQMFEMIVNTNRKQAEIDSLKERIAALQEQQKQAVNVSFNQSTEEPDFIQGSAGESKDQLVRAVADYRQKFKTAASKYDTPAELADLYRQVEYLRSRRQKDYGKSSLTGASGFGLRSSLEGAEQRGGDQKSGDGVKELKEQIAKHETALAVSAQREEEFLAKEQSYENSRKELNAKIAALNAKLNTNSSQTRELECTVEDLRSQVANLKQSIKEHENKAHDTKKLLVQRQMTFNQANLELATKNAALKIEAEKSRIAEAEIKALREENAKLSEELENMNEGHLAAVNNLVAELESEHVTQKRYRERVAVLEGLLSEAQKESRDSQTLAEVKAEEIARLKALVASQTDRIDLLIRIQKMPPEGLKELKENTDLKLQKDVDNQIISDLKAQLSTLQKEAAALAKSLESQKAANEKLAIEASAARAKVERYESRFEEQRKLIVAKNDSLSKLQIELLANTEQLDALRDDIVKAKLEKGELAEQVEFMKRQFNSAFDKDKWSPSYNHAASQTEVPSTEESFKQRFEQQSKQHQREVREYQRKIKVKNDRIKNLTETLESFAPGSKRKIAVETEKELLGGQNDRVGKIAELEAKIVDLEAQLAAKGEVADNFVDLVYERNKDSMMAHVLIEELNAKCANLEALNDQLQNEVSRLHKFAVQQTAEKGVKQRAELMERNFAQLFGEINAQNYQLKDDNSEMRSKAARLEAQVEELEAEKAKQTGEFSARAESLNTELQRLREQVESKLNQNELFSEEIGHKNKRIETAEKEAQTAKEGLGAAEAENRSLKAKLKEVEFVVERFADEKSQNRTLKTRLFEAQNELSEAQHKLSKEVSLHSVLEEQLKRFETVELPTREAKIEDLRREAAELRQLLGGQHKAISKNASKYVERINSLIQENQGLKAKLGEAEAEEEALRQSTFVHDLLYQSAVEKGADSRAPGRGDFKKKGQSLSVVEEGTED